MYEQLKNEMLAELTKKGFDSETVKEVIACLDVAAYDYEITKKATEIVPYNHDLPDIVKMYLISRSVEGYAEGTLYNYRKALHNFFLTAQKPPLEVTALDIRVYLHKYQEERGISNRSLDKVRGYIASFYKWALSEGYIEKDPTVGIGKIKYEKKERTPCTQAELEYLRMACQTPKERAILELFYSSGCRLAELVNLKKSDIDFQEGTVHLLGKGKKHRTSFVNAKAEVAIKEYLKCRTDDNEALFVSDRKPHGPMHTAGVERIIRMIAKRAEEHINHKVTPHVLRHTTATRMLENKADLTSIQAVLGHSNISTTMIYAHTSFEDIKLDHRKAVV